MLDALEAEAERFDGVRVHQMHALHDRPYIHGRHRDHLLHVSYFLSPVTRPAFHQRGCELVPNNFSEVPRLLRLTTKCSLVLAAAPRWTGTGTSRWGPTVTTSRRSSAPCRSSWR